jgi:hypothetical protein
LCLERCSLSFLEGGLQTADFRRLTSLTVAWPLNPPGELTQCLTPSFLSAWGTQLRSLTLINIPVCDSFAFEDILPANVTSLQAISLKGCRLPLAFGRMVLSLCANVAVLDLDYVTWANWNPDVDRDERPFTFLGDLVNLKELHLVQTDIRDSDLECFANVNRALQQLDITSCLNLTATAWTYIAATKELHLNGLAGLAGELTGVSSLFVNTADLQEIKLSDMPALRNVHLINDVALFAFTDWTSIVMPCQLVHLDISDGGNYQMDIAGLVCLEDFRFNCKQGVDFFYKHLVELVHAGKLPASLVRLEIASYTGLYVAGSNEQDYLGSLFSVSVDVAELRHPLGPFSFCTNRDGFTISYSLQKIRYRFVAEDKFLSDGSLLLADQGNNMFFFVD